MFYAVDTAVFVFQQDGCCSAIVPMIADDVGGSLYIDNISNVMR